MSVGEGIGSATVASATVGRLTISLDSELLWGHVHIGNPRAVEWMLNDPDEVRGCYDTLLRILNRNQVPATWAMVGHLWLDRCEDLCAGLHDDETPIWHERRAARPRLFCAPDLLERIRACPTPQEIGYHTFTHPALSHIDEDRARRQLQVGTELARREGIELRSFVYPNNLVAHRHELARAGFSVYRSAPDEPGPGLSGFARRATDRLGLSTPPLVEPRVEDGAPVAIGSSLFFSNLRLPSRLLPHAERGLREAVDRRGCLHVYLHPYNLLSYARLAPDLDAFLGHAARLREAGQLEIVPMRAYAA